MPTDINTVLNDTTRGLEAIPRDNLKTVIDEAYIAVGGLGPELRRLVNGSTALAIDARKNLDPLTTLIDQSKPVLDSQTDTGGLDPGVGGEPGEHHRPAAEPGLRRGRHPAERSGCRR